MSLEAIQHAWTRPGTGNYKLLLVKIADMADGRKAFSCYPGNAYLCRQLGLKERQLQYLLRELEAAGEIHVRKGYARSRGVITYLFKREVLPGLAVVEIADERCIPVHLQDAAQCTSEVQPTAPYPESATVIKTKKGVSLFANGERPEQSRMTLLAVEDAETKRVRLRGQYEDSKRKADAG